MALTPQQIQAIEQAKKEGLTREQALGRVFLKSNVITPEKRFADVGEDITAAGKGVWSDMRSRARNIQGGFEAGARGEQTPIETGAQMAGNILGGAGDIAFRGIQAVTTPFLKESEERAIESGVSSLVEKTGIPQAIAEASPRTQRNIVGFGGLLEGATAGLGTSVTQPIKRGFSTMMDRFRSAPKTATPVVQTAPKTAEQIITDYSNRLRTQPIDPNTPPRLQEAAAQSSMTFKEKMIGLRADEKKRLQEMGEKKIVEYLDATHLRNISDTPTPNSTLPEGVWGPQELGNYYVTDAFRKLETELNTTGSKIGQTRRKLGTVQFQQPQVELIDSTFNAQLDNLGLTVRNGRVVELPNRIAKTTGGDLTAIQSLYDDLLKFKQSPTITNAYDLRGNFDAKIKFGQSARDISNVVDPLSRSVRTAIAKEASKVIGKESATELQKYSDFMDAYTDMKSYIDRSAGSEFLLRRALSGLGREQRALLDTIKEYTGQDLLNDATAMKIALERFGNESQQNLFKQEITRAGLDIASVLSGSPTGILSVAAQRLAEYGIDAEDVIKAAAAGSGGYLLMTYMGEDGEMLPAGLAVLAAMPDAARKQSIRQAQDIAKTVGKDAESLTKYIDEAPNLTPDADLRTNRDVPMRDVAGNKVNVPANTVINPKLNEKGNAVITVNGQTYTIPKNQYENLKGQSTRAVATPFAPELEGTIETVKGAVTGDPKAKAIQLINDKGYTLEEDMMEVYVVKDGEMVDYDDLPTDVQRALDTYVGDAEVRSDINPGQATKYSQYTLPGGENYREILIQAPETLKKGEYGTDVIDKSQTYRSSHWSEPNVISHIRMNERTVDGKKYAFMEELQSDWAREGRDKGFAGSQAEIDALVKKSEELVTKYPVSNRTRNQQAEIDVIGDQINKLTDAQDRGAPNNSLLKDWQIPTTKRALIEAVNSGADRFAWINGEQTSARYNLATHVDEVKWEIDDSSAVRKANGGKNAVIQPKEGKSIFNILVDRDGIITSSPGSTADWKGKKLDEVLGKGLADKIMEKETGTLSGDGLSFGGEWAKNLYDKQVRDIVKKLTGAEVKTVDMGLGVGKEERYKILGSNTFASSKNVQKGDIVTDKSKEDYYVINRRNNGEVDLIPAREIRLQLENDYDLYNKYYPKSERDGEFVNVSMEEMNDAYYQAIDDGVFAQSEMIKTVNLDDVGKQTQQYIDLTPEVKAKIQSKAPVFTMKDGFNVGMPLLLAYFYAGEEAKQ